MLTIHDELKKIVSDSVSIDFALDILTDRPFIDDADILHARGEEEKRREETRKQLRGFPKKLPDNDVRTIAEKNLWSAIIGPEGYRFRCLNCSNKFKEDDVKYWLQFRGELRGIICPFCSSENCRLGWHKNSGGMRYE